METHQHAIHLLLRCFFNVPCIPSCCQRLGVLILICWNEFILIQSLMILPSAGRSYEHCTPPPWLPGPARRFAPFTSAFFVCIWCCWMVSNCCHLSHMVIPCCHWFSSHSISALLMVHLHLSLPKGSGLCSRSLSWCFQWGKKQITFFSDFFLGSCYCDSEHPCFTCVTEVSITCFLKSIFAPLCCIQYHHCLDINYITVVGS